MRIIRAPCPIGKAGVAQAGHASCVDGLGALLGSPGRPANLG